MNAAVWPDGGILSVDVIPVGAPVRVVSSSVTVAVLVAEGFAIARPV